MPTYQYKALNAQGKTVKGIKQGDSPRQIRASLREEELSPLEIQEVSQNKATQALNFSRKKLKSTERSLIFRQLATLLAASLPITEALTAVSEQIDKPHIKTIILGVRAKVEEGHTLAYAMEQFPNAFPEIYCATVAAGEQSSHLDLVLTRLADLSERQQVMREKLQQALIYPSVMAFISICIVGFLLSFVVPKIVGVFSNTGQQLPQATIILIAISDFIRSAGLYIVLLVFLSVFTLRRVLKNVERRFSWHRLLLKLPLIGHMIKTVNTARYARTLGILTQAGVSTLEAMHVSTRVVLNLPIQKSLQQATDKVKEGTAIHRALKETTYFSPMAIHLIASGENSGRLEEMLERTADHQESEVSRLIATGLTLLEPLIIIVMGAIVLFIVLAILLPIFSMDQLNF